MYLTNSSRLEVNDATKSSIDVFFPHVHRQKTASTTRVKSWRSFYAEHVTPYFRLNLVTSRVLYFSPFRYQFYWLVYRSNISVKCFAQEHNIVVILARQSPTLNQIRLGVASLTRLNANTRSTPLYHLFLKLKLIQSHQNTFIQ